MTVHHHDHARHDGNHAAVGDDEAAMAELLDLDAEVLHTYLSEVTAWIHDLAADAPRRRILDVGAGTGTLALLERFEGSAVTALDISARLLHRLQLKARALDVADRVTTVQVDLDAAWPALDPVDLAWASSSLHHVADIDRGRAEQLPHIGSDWGSRLSRAGFTVEAERLFTVQLTPPLPAVARRYAQVSLQHMRAGLTGSMSAEDLATLDTLTSSDGPDAVLRRDDLTVRTTRSAWVARRP